MSEFLTRMRVFRLAAPLIVANATTPLLGLVDTAVLGNGGTKIDLAAISLGALIFNFLYWGFGFLRMTTTGFVAQAHGAGDPSELTSAVARPLFMGLVAGTLLLLTHRGIETLAFGLLSAGEPEELAASGYLRARIWGAPGALAALGATGMLIGLGKTKELLLIQLATNGLNMALDLFFVSVLSMGVKGVGVGTAIAEWGGALLTVFVALRHLRQMGGALNWTRVFDRVGLKKTLRANSDIMVRTLLMIGGFAFFTDQGARLGTVTLAANHMLLQLISLSAFFLDGYAHVAESLVGSAKGAKNLFVFETALRRTTEVALISSLLLGAGILTLGPSVIGLLTDLPEVRFAARDYLIPVAVYVACSVVAFQLDGIFIGCTETRLMRNAAFVSLACFIFGALWLIPRYENRWLWWAFVGYVCVRGLTLYLLLPKLRSGIGEAMPSQGAA